MRRKFSIENLIFYFLFIEILFNNKSKLNDCMKIIYKFNENFFGSDFLLKSISMRLYTNKLLLNNLIRNLVEMNSP
jgi:hypothetical protein